ncbi:MAG TPA: hypothetical protein VIJ93_11710, partial [bacterium]
HQAPVVDAGPNQTIQTSLPLYPTSGAVQPITLIDFHTSVPGLQNINYFPPLNLLIATCFLPSGQNLAVVSPGGGYQPFSALSGFNDETFVATAREYCGGFSLGGFPTGTVFVVTSGSFNRTLFRISPDGTQVQNTPFTLPLGDTFIDGGLSFDQTGLFGGDLIATTEQGRVYRINSAGNATLVAQMGSGTLDSSVVVPNNLARYGPWAGKILALSEDGSGLWSTDAAGNVQSYPFGGQQSVLLVPPGENFYMPTFGTQHVWGAPASQFAPMVGDIILSGGNVSVIDIRWNGTQFITTTICTLPPGGESGCFAPVGLGSILPGGDAQAALQGTVIDPNNPNLPTTVTWSQLSGPTNVEFGDVHSPTSSAFALATGIYTFKLCGSNAFYTSCDTMSVTVVPPACGASTFTPTFTPTETFTPTLTPTGTLTPLTPTFTPIITFTPTNTLTPTNSPTATSTFTPSPTLTPVPGAYVQRIYLGDVPVTDSLNQIWQPAGQ